MAKPNKFSSDSINAAQTELDAIYGATAPEGVVSYGERFLYRPENCARTVGDKTEYAMLAGIPFETMTFDSANGEFTMIAIKLTRPTVALNRLRTPVLVKPGQTVVITKTAMLEAVERVALHPTLEHEVFLKPVGKIDIGDGHTMWQWDVGIDVKNAKPRQAAANLLGSDTSFPALSS